MSSIRDILTDKEIEEIKTRVVEGLINGVFLDKATEIHEGGTNYVHHELNWKVKQMVQDTTMKILKDEVARIAEEVIAPKTQEAAENLMKRFVEQTKQIADKINWYWNIK